jgi:hypothetical protein
MVRLEGKRPIERPRRTLEDNIEMDVQDVWWGAMDWIAVAEYREQPVSLRFI